MQGFLLKADTLNVARTVEILDDFNVAHAFTPSTVLHPREQTIAYTFNTPFITHLIRLHGTDVNFWRIEGIEWVFQPAPELVTTWITPVTTFDLEGWFHHRDAYIATMSTSVVTFAVTINGQTGSPFNYSVPSTSGVYLKQYQVLQPMKAKEVSYSVTASAPFRLFMQDCEVRLKQWGSQGPYLSRKPFGGLSRIGGAEARI